jgi:hypothetical protein
MSRAAVADKLKTATDRHRKLAVLLDWNDGESFSWFRSYTTHDISTKDEYRFDIATPAMENYLLNSGLRSRLPTVDCTLLGLGGFRFKESRGKERVGWTSGRDIDEGAASSPCATPGRNDSCCSIVQPGSGVIHRDMWPNLFFEYILAHEAGHYVGLCHFGHDGIQNIMWTADPDAHLSKLDWGEFGLWYAGKPRFTLDDGKNTWRFIVDQLIACLPGPSEPGPVE